MKRLFIVIAALIVSFSAKAQEPHEVHFNVNQIINNQLTFCDFDSITGIVIQKDPNHTGPTVWIIPGYDYVFSDSITITNENDGMLVYVEMDTIINLSDGLFHDLCGHFVEDYEGNLLYANDETYRRDTLYVTILDNEMPEPYTHELWLSEGVTQILQPTPQDEGYLYVWESDCWPQDSIYQSYTLEITQPGFYRCNMFDQCLHYSKVEYIVHYSPKIEYVTTNLFVNRNELHWIPDSRNNYDTVAIFRDFQFVEYWEYDMGIWVDPIFNNEDGSNLYTLRPVKYGTVMEGRSKWKTGVSLTLHHVYDSTIDISFMGPDNEEGIPLEEYIQYFQLYYKENQNLEPIISMIPVDVNDLYGIENTHDTLVIAAIPFDGEVIFSNMIFPHDITKCYEDHEQSIEFYPNPTDGILNFSACINADFKIFDIQGRLVQVGTIQPQLNISNLIKGIYTLQIKQNGKTFTKNFIRE